MQALFGLSSSLVLRRATEELAMEYVLAQLVTICTLDPSPRHCGGVHWIHHLFAETLIRWGSDTAPLRTESFRGERKKQKSMESLHVQPRFDHI